MRQSGIWSLLSYFDAAWFSRLFFSPHRGFATNKELALLVDCAVKSSSQSNSFQVEEDDQVGWLVCCVYFAAHFSSPLISEFVCRRPRIIKTIMMHRKCHYHEMLNKKWLIANRQHFTGRLISRVKWNPVHSQEMKNDH